MKIKIRKSFLRVIVGIPILTLVALSIGDTTLASEAIQTTCTGSDCSTTVVIDCACGDGGDGSTEVTPPNQGGGNSGGDSGDGGSNNNPGSSSGNSGDEFTIDGEPWCSPSASPESQADAGGISIPGGGLGSTCTWQCGGATLIYGYNEESEDWSAVGGGVNPDIPGGFNEPTTPGGLPTCGDWDTSNVSFSGKQRVEYICWAELSFNGDGSNGSSNNSGVSLGGYNFTCGGNYSVTASSSVPCPSVIRDPYPRALVNTPNQFVMSAGGTSSGSNSREWCEPDVRNYTISLGWDQLPITPIWDWNERSWSDQPGFGKGWIAFHTYDTSSYELSENGPSLEGQLDLPAYQVGVTTYWQPWVADSWEQWHEKAWDCKNVKDSDGVIIGQEGSECAERAACSGAAIGDEACGDWKPHGSGKIMIDMRWFGFPQFYVTRTSARDSTQPPPNIPAIDDNLRQCNIPVPVIESQGILTIP